MRPPVLVAFALALIFVALTTPTATIAYDIPPWVTDPDGICCIFEMYWNRSFSVVTEYGRTTDFYEPHECAQWCCWVEDCYAFEWIANTTSVWGDCKYIGRPCCRVHTYAAPFGGLKNYDVHMWTGYVAWATPPTNMNLTCNDEGYLDVTPWFGQIPWDPWVYPSPDDPIPGADGAATSTSASTESASLGSSHLGSSSASTESSATTDSDSDEPTNPYMQSLAEAQQEISISHGENTHAVNSTIYGDDDE